MNASLAWLRDFVGTRTPAEKLGEKFRMTSSELEKVIDWDKKFQGLVVGKVLKVIQHPNADRLRVATVDVGSEKRTIVCGASNLEKGQFVVVATPGTTLTPVEMEPFTIQVTEIRGQKSEGMLCGLEEIGVPYSTGERHIYVFETEVTPGTPAAEALFESDSVLDLEITPNRPDLLSHYGLAREIAAFEHLKLTPPPLATISAHQKYERAIRLNLEHHKECARYTGIALDVTVGESPWWLKSRLLRSGIRAINNVVDVTNYVMLELGQPMHAFDLDRIPTKDGEHVLGVRLANNGETIDLLDGTTRALNNQDIIIVDATDKPIDLAGIMGGNESSINSETQHVFLEAATFNGPHVRRTSRRLGLRSEASLRFEKGLDCELADKAIKRAVYLLQQIGNAKIASRFVDSRVHPPVRPHIHLSFEDISRALGVRIAAADCKEILTYLGFELHDLTKSGFTATPPSWRRDVSLPEDIIEELIRIWGFERLPYTLPTGAVKAPQRNASVARKSQIRHALAGVGAHETLHITLTSAKALERCGFNPDQALPVSNPLSSETAYLAPSHVIGMLQDCGGTNSEHEELALFEIGKIFILPSKTYGREHEHLTLLVRTAKNTESAVRALKAMIDRTLDVLAFPAAEYVKTDDLPHGEKGHTLDILTGGVLIGKLSLISNEVVSRHKIRRGREIAVAEVNLDVLLALNPEPAFYVSAPTYPTSERDLTITVAQSVPMADVMSATRDTINSDIVRDWYVANIFTGKPLPDNHKAVTLHLIYNSPERTLSDEEIKQDYDKLEKALQVFTKDL